MLREFLSTYFEENFLQSDESLNLAGGWQTNMYKDLQKHSEKV